MAVCVWIFEEKGINYFLICCMGYDAHTAAFCILFIQPVLWCKFSSKSRLAAQEKCAPHKASPFLKNS